GAILIDKDALIAVAEFLRPEHFYKSSHAAIYQAIITLFELHEPVDVVTLSAELKKEGTLTQAGGSAYLSELLTIVPTSAHAAHYGELIREYALKRQLISAAAKLTEVAFGETGSAQDMLDEAEQEIFAIASHSTKRDFVHIKDTLT